MGNQASAENEEAVAEEGVAVEDGAAEEGPVTEAPADEAPEEDVATKEANRPSTPPQRSTQARLRASPPKIRKA